MPARCTRGAYSTITHYITLPWRRTGQGTQRHRTGRAGSGAQQKRAWLWVGCCWAVLLGWSVSGMVVEGVICCVGCRHRPWILWDRSGLGPGRRRPPARKQNPRRTLPGTTAEAVVVPGGVRPRRRTAQTHMSHGLGHPQQDTATGPSGPLAKNVVASFLWVRVASFTCCLSCPFPNTHHRHNGLGLRVLRGLAVKLALGGLPFLSSSAESFAPGHRRRGLFELQPSRARSNSPPQVARSDSS